MLRRIVKRLMPQSKSMGPVNLDVCQSDGSRASFTVQSGQTLLSILRQNQILVSSFCGGMCSCGTCAVLIKSGTPTDATSREVATLGFSAHQAGERLACQLRVESDLVIQLLDRY